MPLPQICHQETAPSVDEQRQRVREAGSEGDDSARTTIRSELDADDASAESAAVVLPPLGDEQASAVVPRKRLARVEGEPVGRGVRLAVGRRWRDAGAAADETKGARIRPTARPAIAGAPLDRNERVRYWVAYAAASPRGCSLRRKSSDASTGIPITSHMTA